GGRDEPSPAGLVERRLDGPVDAVGRFGALGYRSYSGAPAFPDRPEHVKAGSGAALPVPRQPLLPGRLEQSVSTEPAEVRGLEVIIRDVVSRFAARCDEGCALGVICASGEAYQRLLGMRRPAHPEVQLDREGLPPARLARDHEVDPESADHPDGGEALSHAPSAHTDRDGVGRICGDAATEVLLTASPAEDLVVSGYHFDPAGRRDLELDARAADLYARDPRFQPT